MKEGKEFTGLLLEFLSTQKAYSKYTKKFNSYNYSAHEQELFDNYEKSKISLENFIDDIFNQIHNHEHYTQGYNR